MAVTAEVYAGEQYQFGLAPQAAWGTATTDGASYRKLNLTNIPMPDYGDLLANDNKRAGNGLVPDYQDYYRAEAGSWPKFSLEGIVTNEELPYLIYGVMQQITSEAPIAPFQRIHDWSGTTLGLSGITPIKFYSAAFYSPVSGQPTVLKNCVMADLELSAAAKDAGGLISFKASLVSFGAAARGATLNPSNWTAHGSTNWGWGQLNARTLDGNDLVMSSWSLKLSNGLIPLDGVDANGNADGVRFQALKAMAEIKALKQSITAGAIAKWLANPTAGSAESVAIIRYGLAAASNMFSFELNGVVESQPGVDPKATQGSLITIPLLGVKHTSTNPLQIKQTNNTDLAWT